MDHFSNAKVQVKQGWLQGYTEGELKIFKGIPYAAPRWENSAFATPRIPAAGGGSERPPSTAPPRCST